MSKLDWQDTVYQGHNAKIALIDNAVVDITDPKGRVTQSIYFKKNTITWREDDEIGPMIKWSPKNGFIKQVEN